jgi:hypothetical protein
MGLAKGLAAAGDDDMGTNSGACTLNLNGVDGADTTATTGLIAAAAAAAVVSAAPSSSWWWEILVVVVAHCCLSLLLISCAMIDGGGEPIGRSACRGRGSRLYIYNIYTGSRLAGRPETPHHSLRLRLRCDDAR